MENRLPIGEFIRTTGGRIGKIMDYTLQYEIKYVDNMIVDEPHEAYLMDTNYSFDDEHDVWTDDMIKSHGKRLIDVIEHGDLVNGRFVVSTGDGAIDLLTDTDLGISLENDEIIGVVCHEILEREGYDGRRL